MSNFKGWILDAIPRDSAIAANVNIEVYYLAVSRRLLVNPVYLSSFLYPRVGDENLFVHHRSFLHVDKKRDLKNSRNRIWLTHFDDKHDLIELFTRRHYIDKLFVQNLQNIDSLVKVGFDRNVISLQPGAIDRNRFFPDKHNTHMHKYFLITGDCKDRKNPFFVKWLISNFPDFNFVIHGNGWKEFDEGSLNHLPNLTIFEFSFNNQAEILRNALGLLILSTLEGGPISLLESLACGTPVISTDVGFAKEILDDSRGTLVNPQPSIEYWRNVFQLTIEKKYKNRHLDLLQGSYSWEALGNELYR